MFNFVKKIFSKEQKLLQGDKNQNTTNLNIIVDKNGVRINRLNGKTEEIKWDEIGEVSIITTSDGPFTDDVYLCLHSTDDKTGCAIPSTVNGYNEVYDIVSKYEGFDFKTVIEAMSCATDAKFTLWKK